MDGYREDPIWMSVLESSSRLPDMGTRVLIHIINKSGSVIKIGFLEGRDKNHKLQWYIDGRDYGWVTHWMPLPWFPDVIIGGWGYEPGYLESLERGGK